MLIAVLSLLSALSSLAFDCKFSGSPANRKATDILFLLDSSGSIDDSEWAETKRFAALVVAEVVVPEVTIRFGVVIFSAFAETRIALSANQGDMQDKISNIARLNGGTATDQALTKARDVLSLGDALEIVVLMTDGASNDQAQTLDKAKLLKDAGVLVVTVGVGDGVNTAELSQIASSSDVEFYAQFDSQQRVASALTSHSVSDIAHVIADGIRTCVLAMVSTTTTSTTSTTTTSTTTTSTTTMHNPKAYIRSYLCAQFRVCPVGWVRKPDAGSVSCTAPICSNDIDIDDCCEKAGEVVDDKVLSISVGMSPCITSVVMHFRGGGSRAYFFASKSSGNATVLTKWLDEDEHVVRVDWQADQIVGQAILFQTSAKRALIFQSVSCPGSDITRPTFSQEVPSPDYHVTGLVVSGDNTNVTGLIFKNICRYGEYCFMRQQGCPVQNNTFCLKKNGVYTSSGFIVNGIPSCCTTCKEGLYANSASGKCEECGFFHIPTDDRSGCTLETTELILSVFAGLIIPLIMLVHKLAGSTPPVWLQIIEFLGGARTEARKQALRASLVRYGFFKQYYFSCNCQHPDHKCSSMGSSRSLSHASFGQIVPGSPLQPPVAGATAEPPLAICGWQFSVYQQPGFVQVPCCKDCANDHTSCCVRLPANDSEEANFALAKQLESEELARAKQHELREELEECRDREFKRIAELRLESDQLIWAQQLRFREELTECREREVWHTTKMRQEVVDQEVENELEAGEIVCAKHLAAELTKRSECEFEQMAKMQQEVTDLDIRNLLLEQSVDHRNELLEQSVDQERRSCEKVIKGLEERSRSLHQELMDQELAGTEREQLAESRYVKKLETIAGCESKYDKLVQSERIEMGKVESAERSKTNAERKKKNEANDQCDNLESRLQYCEKEKENVETKLDYSLKELRSEGKKWEDWAALEVRLCENAFWAEREQLQIDQELQSRFHEEKHEVQLLRQQAEFLRAEKANEEAQLTESSKHYQSQLKSIQKNANESVKALQASTEAAVKEAQILSKDKVRLEEYVSRLERGDRRHDGDRKK